MSLSANVMKKQNDLIRRSPDDWIIGDSVNLFWNFSLIPSRSAQLDVLYYVSIIIHVID